MADIKSKICPPRGPLLLAPLGPPGLGSFTFSQDLGKFDMQTGGKGFTTCVTSIFLEFYPNFLAILLHLIIRLHSKQSGECLKVKGYKLANFSLCNLSCKGKYSFLFLLVLGYSSVLPNNSFYLPCSEIAIWISVFIFERRYSNIQYIRDTPES